MIITGKYGNKHNSVLEAVQASLKFGAERRVMSSGVRYELMVAELQHIVAECLSNIAELDKLTGDAIEARQTVGVE
jgi:hypothetical protein